MAEVLIVGGGVAGLAAALGLARRGHAVRVLERDAAPLPASALEAFEHWERRGAPQLRHSHAFLARLRNLLRDRAPDVLEALLAAGAEELRFGDLLPPGIDDRSARPGDEDLVMLACRRTTFEWVLRRAAAAEPGVRFEDAAEVQGLELATAGANGAPPRVTGVRASRAGGPVERLSADLVIDASGRRSRLSRWLVAAGAAPLPEDSAPCGIFYCSRFYRLRPGVAPPLRDTTIGADLGYAKYAIFHGDTGIFSITFAASPEDAPLRGLLRPGPFEAATAALPALRSWSDPSRAEPISRIHGMAALRNLRRHFVVEGEPRLLGLLPLGDAAIHTNPLYGRGCTLAWVHAERLLEAFDAHGDDHAELARSFDAATREELLPWYRAAVAQDAEAARVARLERGETHELAGSGAPGTHAVDPRAFLRSLVRDGLLPALRSDALVARRFFRAFNLLDGPGDWMRDPEVLNRVLAFQRAGAGRDAPALGPDRAALIACLARA